MLNLGVGIAACFGFQHDDNLKTANKDLENRVKDMTDQRDWYQFQALSYRAYMGQFNPKDAGTLADRRAQFNRGALGAKAPDFAEASTLIVTNLEKDHKLSTDPQIKLGNYEALIADLKKTNDTLTTQVNELRTAKEKAEAGKKNAEDRLEDEIQKSNEALVKLQQA